MQTTMSERKKTRPKQERNRIGTVAHRRGPQKRQEIRPNAMQKTKQECKRTGPIVKYGQKPRRKQCRNATTQRAQAESGCVMQMRMGTDGQAIRHMNGTCATGRRTRELDKNTSATMQPRPREEAGAQNQMVWDLAHEVGKHLGDTS